MFFFSSRATKTLPTQFEFFLFRKLSTVAIAGIDASKNEDESVNIRLKCIVALLKLLMEFNVFKVWHFFKCFSFPFLSPESEATFRVSEKNWGHVCVAAVVEL